MSAESIFRKITRSKLSMIISVCLLLTTTLSIVTVRAVPITVTVTPSDGPVGSTIIVSGGDASSNGEVGVYLNSFIFMATTTANTTGGFFVKITVPAIPADTYDIMVVDVDTGDRDSASFTVQPKIVLTSEEGSHEKTVIVNGYGFRVFTLITLLLNETDVTPIPQPQTGNLGNFEANFTVPMMPNGTYPVKADDGTNNASALFTVVPKITLSPRTSGPPGTLVTVFGTGFAASANITVKFDATDVTSYGGLFTGPQGAFMLPGFFVPDTANGTHLVNATDETGISTVVPFMVPSPFMILTPNSTFGSSTVNATGAGFPPYTPVLLYLEDILLVDLMDLMMAGQTMFADEHGSYQYSFVVPIGIPGVYTVTAYSARSEGESLIIDEEVASAALTIVEDPLLAEIEDDIETMEANLTDINARLVGIEGTVAIIETDLGTIEADLSDIQLDVTEINGDVATIETTLGTIEGRITSIEGDTATIETELGTVMADISHLKGVQETFTVPLYAAVALAAIAAAGTVFMMILTRRKSSAPSQSNVESVPSRTPLTRKRASSRKE
jgi:hypothetical protein